jgi:hypothetical protein
VLTGVTSCFADSGLQCQPGVEVKFPELTRATALGSAVLVLRADTQHQCYTSNAVAMHDVTMEGMDTASSLMSPGAGTSPPKEGGDVACRSIRTAPGTPTGRASAAPWVVLVSITDRAPKIQTRIASAVRHSCMGDKRLHTPVYTDLPTTSPLRELPFAPTAHTLHWFGALSKFLFCRSWAWLTPRQPMPPWDSWLTL